MLARQKQTLKREEHHLGVVGDLQNGQVDDTGGPVLATDRVDRRELDRRAEAVADGPAQYAAQQAHGSVILPSMAFEAMSERWWEPVRWMSATRL